MSIIHSFLFAESIKQYPSEADIIIIYIQNLINSEHTSKY